MFFFLFWKKKRAAKGDRNKQNRCQITRRIQARIKFKHKQRRQHSSRTLQHQMVALAPRRNHNTMLSHKNPKIIISFNTKAIPQSTIVKSATECRIARESKITFRPLAAHCSTRWWLHTLDGVTTLCYPTKIQKNLYYESLSFGGGRTKAKRVWSIRKHTRHCFKQPVVKPPYLR